MKDILEIIALLSTAYPNMDVKPETIKLYARLLADIDPDMLKAAVLKHISENKWFPTIAELRGAAVALVNYDKPLAADAWKEVCDRIRSHGYIRKPTFSSPLIERAVGAIGGWRAVCFSENPTADRARFIQAYESYLQRETQDMVMLPQVKKQIQAGPVSISAYLGVGHD